MREGSEQHSLPGEADRGVVLEVTPSHSSCRWLPEPPPSEVAAPLPPGGVDCSSPVSWALCHHRCLLRAFSELLIHHFCLFKAPPIPIAVPGQLQMRNAVLVAATQWISDGNPPDAPGKATQRHGQRYGALLHPRCLLRLQSSYQHPVSLSFQRLSSKALLSTSAPPHLHGEAQQFE